MARREIIHQLLTQALHPEVLEVSDESHLHKDHAHSHPHGESHFRVLVVASAFDGLSRLARQRRIHALLPQLASGDIHAMVMRLYTPPEYES